jgi:hypothetical protein
MTSVKFFHSGMSGAPQTGASAGTTLAVLNACLVTGWGTAVVTLAVAAEVATVTAAGHPFSAGMVTEISGANPAGLNGQKRVLSSAAGSYTFAAPGVPDGAATGTISHKVAPAGWESPFSSGTVAVYRSLDPASTGACLRVDDSAPGPLVSSRVTGYQSMSDLNTGVSPFPSAAQMAGGGYWARTVYASGQAWAVVADTRGFYFFVKADTVHKLYFFGDFKSRKSPDAHACVLTANVANTTPYGGAMYAGDVSGSDPDGDSGAWMSASYVGVGGSKAATLAGLFPVGLTVADRVYSGAVGAAYPNGADNGLILVPTCIGELSPNCWRGVLPGGYFCPQNIGTGNIQHLTTVTDVGGLPGRTLLALLGSVGPYFVDITGPWR